MTSRGTAFCGVSVQEGTQEDTITTADFDQFAGDYFAEIDWAAGVNLFTFDPVGIAFIQSKIGAIAKVCLREYDHDYKDVQPGVNELFQSGCYGPTWGVDADEPQFIITYEQ